jgi:Uma2 family endonuclease
MSRHQYDRLVEIGEFGPDDRVELLEGYLVTMSPHDPRHSNVIRVLTKLLMRVLPADLELQVQLPIAATETSEPEPDLAVIPLGDYGVEHPRTAPLVIEVANTSRRLDLGPKARIYATAGVTEYWVVDVINDVVFRHLAPTGAGYAELTEHGGGRLRSTAVPEVEVDLDDLLAR